MIGPILYNVMQLYNGETAIAMWQAITLQGGGLYHLSMGAIIGISSHGRTQEKLNYQSPLTPQSPLDTN